jgi:hypothetical protein
MKTWEGDVGMAPSILVKRDDLELTLLLGGRCSVRVSGWTTLVILRFSWFSSIPPEVAGSYLH